jgi:hypothetical protein
MRANKEVVCDEHQPLHQAPWLFDFVGHRVNPAATIQRIQERRIAQRRKVLKPEAL